MLEEWRRIQKHPSYEVSDAGRVRRLPGEFRRNTHILKTPPNSFGYLIAPLWEGRRVVRTVHSLVLGAFVGERPEGLECRHLNGDNNDARLSNLAWGTPKENAADKLRHGTRSRGESHGQAKLTAQCVRRIVERVAAGEPQYRIAAEFGVHQSQVSRIVNGRAWEGVSH